MKVPDIAGCGVFDSRITFGGKTKSSSRTVKFFEIEYYARDGKASFIDGEEYPILEGSVIIAKPGQTRYSLLHLSSSYLWIVPDDGEVCRLLASLPAIISVSEGEKCESLLSEIRQARRVPFSGAEFFIGSKLLELVCLLKRDAERYERCEVAGISRKNNADGIIKATSFMDENFSKKLTLADCAKSASLSTVYFHRVFTAVMGKTPHEYLADRRMNAAVDMLTSTEFELSRIAVECGFGSQSYFSRLFKERFGITPGEYRLSNRFNVY